jgi:hypothetical protein
LVRGLEERVVAVEVRVLPFDDVLDRAERCRCDVPDALDVLGDASSSGISGSPG